MSRPRIYSPEDYVIRKRQLSREWRIANPYMPKVRGARRDKHTVTSPSPGMSCVDEPGRERVPQQMIEDRDRRKDFVHESIVSNVMHDPPPGQSALHQKRNPGAFR